MTLFKKIMAYKKLLLVSIVVFIILFAGWMLYRQGRLQIFSAQNIQIVQSWIRGLGPMGVIVYMLLFAVGTMAFLPSLPFTIIGGLVYGFWLGTLYASVADLMGASAAFFIGRYGARERVEKWLGNNKIFNEIDAGVKEQGWRIVVITRLVPLFPHSVQNYVYGLTSISYRVYGLVSYLCILPGTAIWVFAVNTLGKNQDTPKRMVIYLAIAGILLVMFSYIPRWIHKRKYLNKPKYE